MRNLLGALTALLGLLTVAALGTLLGVGSAAATTSIVATPSDRHGWTFDETRTGGRYAFTADGLHIWTTDADTSLNKVAGYVPAGVTLASVAVGPAPGLDYDVTAGPLPGLQLVTVYDGVVRILVGESVYGDKWWMTNLGCNQPTVGWCDSLGVTWTPGGGSAHSATLAQWSTALPGATVAAFGFSLGSGVPTHTDGTVRSLTLGETSFTFDVDPVATTTSQSSSSTTTSSQTSSSTQASTTSSLTSSASSTSRPTTRYSWPTTTTTRRAVVARGDDLAYTGTGGVGPLVAIGGVLLLGGGCAILIVVLRNRRRDRTDAS